MPDSGSLPAVEMTKALFLFMDFDKELSESGFSGLQDEQDYLKSWKSYNQENPDSDRIAVYIIAASNLPPTTQILSHCCPLPIPDLHPD
jgi:hypothetical protein